MHIEQQTLEEPLYPELRCEVRYAFIDLLYIAILNCSTADNPMQVHHTKFTQIIAKLMILEYNISTFKSH